MLRRSINSQLTAVTGSVRRYTDYSHYDYPIWHGLSWLTFGLWFALYVGFMRTGSVYTKRSSWKEDNLRIWRRKLGKGYKWAEDWGPEVKTMFKNLPDRAV
jgi:hypothetical protein